MIRVLAIDDEPLALQQLVAYIRKIPFLELVAECQSALEAKELLNRESVDAVFCDINMPDLNGMDFVKTDYRVVKLAVSDIRYIEGMSEYLKIYLEGQKPVITLLSMKKMEEYLPPYFMRIHRSYIINLKKIQEVNKNRVILDADTYLPIGDNYREAFNNYLNTKFLGK